MANTVTIAIPSSFDASARQAVGRAVVDFIVRRTKRGVDIQGSKFRGNDGDGKYSDSYRASGEFEAAGKSPRRINMTLTGDMLDSLEVISTRPGFITIGYPDGPESQKSIWMREKGYNFLGIKNEDLQKILAEFSQQTDTDRVVQDISSTVADSFLRRLFGGN